MARQVLDRDGVEINRTTGRLSISKPNSLVEQEILNQTVQIGQDIAIAD